MAAIRERDVPGLTWAAVKSVGHSYDEKYSAIHTNTHVERKLMLLLRAVSSAENAVELADPEDATNVFKRGFRSPSGKYLLTFMIIKMAQEISAQRRNSQQGIQYDMKSLTMPPSYEHVVNYHKDTIKKVRPFFKNI